MEQAFLNCRSPYRASGLRQAYSFIVTYLFGCYLGLHIIFMFLAFGYKYLRAQVILFQFIVVTATCI